MAKSSTTWKKGQSGNPNGRPKGSRDALNEQAIKDIYADWKKHGTKALKATREERPAEYVRAVVSLIPKDANLNVKNDMNGAFLEALKGVNQAAALERENAKLREQLETLGTEPSEPTQAGKVVH